MSQVLENNKWWRDKRPIIDGYLESAKQIENTVAGNGLLYRPGFLGGVITNIERKVKFDLSQVNYEIVKQAIERELIATGHSYDISVKEAMIAWELERTVLFTALDQEFADNKRVRDLGNQEFDRLEITTNLRKLVIMTLKTALDIEIEELRQEMTLVDKSTFSAEDALLAANLLTAQKKLEVIPYIETVIEKQQLVIVAELNNVDRKGALITEKDGLNTERKGLITAKETLSGKIGSLVTAKKVLVTAKETLITAKEDLANGRLVNIPYLEQYLDTLDNLNTENQEIAAAKKDNLPYMQDYITVLGELDAAKESLAEAKLENIPYMGFYIDALNELADAKRELADAKLANVPYVTMNIAKQEELMTAKENLAAAKLLNVPHMEQYILSIEDLITAQEDLIDTKETVIMPKVTEKSISLEAYTEELRQWMLVKDQIADVRKNMATLRETGAEHKGDLLDSQGILNDLRLDLREASINLELAKIDGRTTLMTQKITNAALMLTERGTSFDATQTRDGELLDAQINFDLYEEQEAFESLKEINNWVIPREQESIEKIALARINERGELAEVAANAKLTSQLVHLLA